MIKSEVHFSINQCSLGLLLVAANQDGVCAIFLHDNQEVLMQNLLEKFPQAKLSDSDNTFKETVAKIIAYIESPTVGIDIALDIQGTDFQQRVWQALKEIPLGTTASYSDIAVRIGSPKAVRAVAKACATNSIAIAIPCHRVVRQDGSISGYRWGVERKRILINREAEIRA